MNSQLFLKWKTALMTNNFPHLSFEEHPDPSRHTPNMKQRDEPDDQGLGTREYFMNKPSTKQLLTRTRKTAQK